MIVNGETLADLGQGFKALVSAGVKNYQSKWPHVATEVPSTHAAENYKWLGRFARMREWIGDKAFGKLEAFGFQIINKDWEASAEVDRNDIEDDNLGIYKPMFADLGQEGPRHQDFLAFRTLFLGFTSLCYDGQNFFDTDHPVGSTTVSNKGTAVLSADAYAAARAGMTNLMDDTGDRPLGIMPNLLVVGPQNEGLAKSILFSEKNPDQTANVNYHTAELLVVPGYTTQWYLLDTTRAIKPLVMQVRKPVTFVAMDTPTDEKVFTQKKFRYSVEARYNVGYALWQLAYGSTGAGS